MCRRRLPPHRSTSVSSAIRCAKERVMNKNPWVGSWTYRRLLNDPDGSVDFDKLEFGEGTIGIHDDAAEELLTGTIGGEGWSLDLHGSRAYGSPSQVRFQGK